jgi:hypothetical protein
VLKVIVDNDIKIKELLRFGSSPFLFRTPVSHPCIASRHHKLRKNSVLP